MPSSVDPSAPTPNPTVGSVQDADKAELATRFLAAIIDGTIISILSFLLGWISGLGTLAGAAYVVLRDGLEVGPLKHQSVGKYVAGLRAVRMDGQPLSLEDSFQRNWMLGLMTFSSVLGSIWIVGGFLGAIAGTAGFVFLIYETHQVVTRDDGRRWGDRRAETKVIEVDDVIA